MTPTPTTTSGAADLRTAAQAVIDRWDTPLWKDVPATAEYIGRLRAALAAGQATTAQAGAQDDLITLRKPTTSAELLWLLKLAHLVISDVDKTLEKTFAPAQPAAQHGVAYADAARAALAAGQATAAQQVVAYAALPEPDIAVGNDGRARIYTRKDIVGEPYYTAGQLRDFADATCALRASHWQASSQAASSAVLKAIREANMRLVRTGDDAFMLVPYKAVTAQAADSVTAPAPPPECETEAEKRAFAFGWFKALESERMKAESVQEDAARLDFLIEQRAYVVSDPDACPGHWLHWARPDGDTWVQIDKYPTPRAAIDAARKQEEKQ